MDIWMACRFDNKALLFFFPNPHLRMCLLIWQQASNVFSFTNIDVKERYQSAASCIGSRWALRPQPFGIWDNAPSNWAIWPGLDVVLFLRVKHEYNLKYPSMEEELNEDI